MSREMILKHVTEIDKRLERINSITYNTSETAALLLQAKSTALLALATMGNDRPSYEVRV